MSEFELFFPLQDSKYGDGLVLNKHGDRYSLVCAKKSTKAEGTVFMEWAFPQDKDRKPRDKAIPLGVKIGNHTEAVSLLLQLLAALGHPANGKPADDSEIPF